MEKQIIRLTESDLHQIVKESVNKILTELDWKTYASAAKKRPEQGEDNKAEQLAQFATDRFNDKFGHDELDGTYDENVYALPGAVSISLEAEGDSSSFAADDDPDFFTMYVNNGYTGSLELTLLSEDYLTKVLGQTKDNKGVMSYG